jgi:long-chain fatty acid transport protein
MESMMKLSGGNVMRAIFSARLSALVLIVSLSSASLVHGEAFRVLGQGNSGTAQGDAFAAQADDPSAIFYNPAGMTQLEGIQLSASVLFIAGHYDYESPGGEKFKGNLNGSIATPPPTNVYLTAKLDKLGNKLGTKLLDNFALGVGINSPFGLVINWPNNVPFSAVTTFAQLPLIDVMPTLAYKANDYLSLGAGLDIYTFIGFLGGGKVRTRSFFPSDGNSALNGKDTAVGFNIGFLLTPWRTEVDSVEKPRLNLAFVYRSAATLNLTGDFLIDGQKAARAAFDLKLPQIFTWGAALWPIRDKTSEWKLETDLDYVGWSSFKNLDIRLSNGITLPQPRNWKNIVTIKFGTEYKWLEIPGLPDWELALRGGYIRANTPVPELTFDPRIPNSDFNGASLGIGVLCKGNAMFLGLFECGNGVIKAIGLDLIYKNQLYDSRRINNNIDPTVNGKYKTELQAGGIGIRINF